MVLPDPPGTVDLCMVKEEGWISWGGENVSAWVSTDSKVATSVYATERDVLATVKLRDHVYVLEASCEVSLHGCLEGGNVDILCDQVGGVLIGIPLQM